jgi:hypothetical protein
MQSISRTYVSCVYYIFFRRYGIWDVFIATDDPSVVAHARESERRLGGSLRFVAIDTNRYLCVCVCVCTNVYVCMFVCMYVAV